MLILASTSPWRINLLTQAGLRFQAVSPDFEEQWDPEEQPETVVLRMAEGKAWSVADQHPDAVVVGADQVLEHQGLSLGKAPNAAAARKQLESLSGQTHRLITGVVVIGATPPDGGRPTLRLLEETRLTVRSLEPWELDAYVKTGEWQGCAGSYRIEGRGIQLFEKIEGDHTNILGLPMLALLEALRRVGLEPMKDLT